MENRAFVEVGIEPADSLNEHIGLTSDGLRSSVTAGGTLTLYVSSTGDDSNPGTEASPIKTMAKFVEIMNRAEYAQYTCYLVGSATYDIASLVINQACPHIYAYNGNPTLRFTANASVGTRFYSGRVHLEGRNNYTLKISSVCGHHYFENCSITARNVEFLVPISIYGSF